MMKMKYWLPSKEGEKRIDCETEYNSVVIIGGNGSGKSKLGAWLEQQDMSVTHRIAAQRSLVFNPDAQLMTYTNAESIILNGSTEQRKDRGYKWNWGKGFTTKLVTDFDATLAAIVAKKNNQQDEYFKECDLAEKHNLPKPSLPRTKISELLEIWDLIFPQRKLVVEDSRFYAVGPMGNSRYSASEMSDGERGVLYLAAQILALDKGRLIIVDEPETHLHGSIMNNLWAALERARNDCQFVYITHDINFAARHTNSDKYWIKSFDGKLWDYVKIEDNDLPQDLLLEILGARQNVLFVEGTKDSLDTRLYSLLFPDVNIIPCGSCTTVVERTKAFSKCTALSWCKVKGLVDRDYRSEHEIAENSKDGIYTLNVAEVENLFIVESLLRKMIGHMGKKDAVADNALQKIKDYIVQDRYVKQCKGQRANALVAGLKYYLSVLDVTNVTDGPALQKAVAESNVFGRAEKEVAARYSVAEPVPDYDKVLLIFNEKGLSKSVGHFMDIVDKKYQDTVIGVLAAMPTMEVRALFEKYIPFDKLEA